MWQEWYSRGGYEGWGQWKLHKWGWGATVNVLKFWTLVACKKAKTNRPLADQDQTNKADLDQTNRADPDQTKKGGPRSDKQGRPRSDKQGRLRSDCFWRSSLIRVFPVCYSNKQFVDSSPHYQHFIWEQKEKSVQNFGTFTVSVSSSHCSGISKCLTLGCVGYLSTQLLQGYSFQSIILKLPRCCFYGL